MDKLIELLPLPSVLLNWPHPTNHVAIRDYARACVAHATTTQAAETEALRAEVERLKVVAHGFVDEIALKDRRAEQLAEALRGWWEARRPVGWTEEQHRSCPHVNLATDAEEALATALLRAHDSKYEHEEDTNDR